MANSKSINIEEQLALARREIHNLRQQLSSLTYIHQREIKNIYSKLENWQCLECKKDNAVENLSVALVKSTKEFQFKPIGSISTHFPEKRGTPRQSGVCKDTIGKLVLSKDVFTNPCHALEGLQEFSHMWILFYFHKNDSSHSKAKVAPPRLNGIRTGVFATRSPHRPCPIGLSLVKIDRIMDSTIYFSGVDMVDQTPVFDIKPYIPQYDNPGLNIISPTETMLDSVDNIIELSDNAGSNLLTEEIYTLNTAQSSTQVEIQQERVLEGYLSSREMDGQENERESQIVEVPENIQSRNEVIFHRRSNSRIGEREAPDGEEEEPSTGTPSSSAAHLPSTSGGHVRVPSWIDQAPVPKLTVSFKDRALVQLSELRTDSEEKKKVITNVLQEDPRSVYLRERWGGHCYVFRIAELYVSCKFNDSNHSVTVYQLFQNERHSGSNE